ncbi:hypothetical protein WOLCODRAFT_139190 [Wolfiporia cocos MD-104 SS10]|uniref:BHLH domain-containing protein n=1 Tax=Wolfiporia cocos (strain MD-104) TaxID=742152 RepID=A0A2H3K3K2_WOLCO|nr:hypothetical protein WOLCODRAFT_139190 [Wolfiporia cocos MD-104 SS10]
MGSGLMCSPPPQIAPRESPVLSFCPTMSTPPLSSDSSSASSPSPSVDNSQFPSDETLDLLLQTISQNVDSASDSSQVNTPPEWERLSSWVRPDGKMPDFGDFNFSLPMDLDFNPNMSVDPSTLHFNSLFDSANLALPNDNAFLMPPGNIPNDFPLSGADDMSWLTQSHVEPTTGRRLSITSSSSSSGASLSPVMDAASVSSTPSSDSWLNDPAQELAHKVRQMAGVTLAVPVSAQVQQMAAAGGQAKLPIPRLPRPNVSPAQTKPSPPKSSPSPDSASAFAAASASASTSSAPSPKGESPAEALPQPLMQSVIGRPKTSHTTIERRYRTNLNARITGLKQAVPALRVLEAKVTGQPNPWGDDVDARGFVDGVKVARKMSKANVLGKAAEYIQVLKRREARLRREQDGLKSLIAGLVGGPALLKEWEREWREQFGGAEKDEIEEQGAGAASDEEEDGDESDGEDGEGRARKKAKLAKPVKKEKPPRPAAPPAPAVPAVPGAAPEKRKRGRPRKVPLPPVAPASSAVSTPIANPAPRAAPPIFPADTQMHDFTQAPSEGAAQQQPAQQYLLAAFAFFSVFNSPLTSRSHTYAGAHAEHAHAHHGTVLTPHEPTASHVPAASAVSPGSGGGVGLHELVQAAHLLVSTLVFLYVLVPWLSGALRRTRGISAFSAYFARASCAGKPEALQMSPPVRGQHRAALMGALEDVLDPARRGSPDEATRLRGALGVSDGLLGLLQGVIKAGRVDRGIELNQLEQRAWVRLGELVAFNDQVGSATRLQTYWCMSWHISTFAASTTDLSTLALIMRPVSSAKAAALWDAARSREYLRPYEKIVLDNMSVDVAADWLGKWQRWHQTERKGRCAACEKRTPLGVLAAILIRERLRKHAAALFVRTVVRDESRMRGADACDAEDYVYDVDKDLRDEHERTETVQAGRSIGGRTAELAVLLERIWDTGFCTQEEMLPAARRAGASPDEDADCEDAHDLASTDEAEIRALLRATLVYRRIFPASLPACPTFVLSPPPSPSRRNAALHMALRTALGSPAFEFGSGGRLEDEGLSVALEDARDRVNDMLVELEQTCRRGRF